MNKLRLVKMILLMVIVIELSSCTIRKNTPEAKLPKEFTILGYGDSITEGGPEFFSYLFPLDSMLKSAGFQATFIGPRKSQQDGKTLSHFGNSGRTAEYVAARVDSVYSLFPADLVLLHAGHNHFIEEAPVGGIVNAQRKIIQTITGKNPAALVLVAGVITSGKLPKYEYIPDLNIAIKAMVESLHNKNVLFVDQSVGWDWEKYTISDKVHPNRAGATRMAGKWCEVIRRVAGRER